MFGQITELPKAQGVCDIKVIQISATHMKNMWRRGVVVSLLHNFIQLSLNSGSTQVQTLFVACRRFAMVRISDKGPGWK